MFAKTVLCFALLLLVKEATSLNCYVCASTNMENCNSNMYSVSCGNALYDRCFKFLGTARNTLGGFQPHAEKGCGYEGLCSVINVHPDFNTQECYECKGNNCNTSSLITSKPMLVVVLFAIARKLFS